jgi:hypothetical protein
LARTDYREVLTYILPNEFAVPKLTPAQVEQGWEAAPSVIDDNIPDLRGIGHGTPGKSQQPVYRDSSINALIECFGLIPYFYLVGFCLKQNANRFCCLVACVAGALGNLGVAPRANLYLFKQEGYLINRNTGETVSSYITQSGLVKLTSTILSIIESQQVPPGRVVINISFGMSQRCYPIQ